MNDDSLQFARSRPFSLGCELEVMLIDPDTGDLAGVAVPLVRALEAGPHGTRFKLEVTQSMLELTSSVHDTAAALAEELRVLGACLHAGAGALGVRVCGGGLHPFHRWAEREITPGARFGAVADRYGYLAQQFTVFGQHIHVGVESGDDAVRVAHALTRYVPQLIALAASSPIYRRVDTRFDCARLNFVSSFPLSGHLPPLLGWRRFVEWAERLHGLGIVSSLKDFYWDVRPKPEYGTVEIRVCDTPLDVELAADLAAYAQALVWELLREPREPDLEALYLPYAHNRFEACRFGLDGRVVLPGSGERRLADDVCRTVERLGDAASALDSGAALARLARRAAERRNGAAWMRERLAQGLELPALVAACASRWEDACVPELRAA